MMDDRVGAIQEHSVPWLSVSTHTELSGQWETTVVLMVFRRIKNSTEKRLSILFFKRVDMQNKKSSMDLRLGIEGR